MSRADVPASTARRGHRHPRWVSPPTGTTQPMHVTDCVVRVVPLGAWHRFVLTWGWTSVARNRRACPNCSEFTPALPAIDCSLAQLVSHPGLTGLETAPHSGIFVNHVADTKTNNDLPENSTHGTGGVAGAVSAELLDDHHPLRKVVLELVGACIPEPGPGRPGSGLQNPRPGFQGSARLGPHITRPHRIPGIRRARAKHRSSRTSPFSTSAGVGGHGQYIHGLCRAFPRPVDAERIIPEIAWLDCGAASTKATPVRSLDTLRGSAAPNPPPPGQSSPVPDQLISPTDMAHAASQFRFVEGDGPDLLTILIGERFGTDGFGAFKERILPRLDWQKMDGRERGLTAAAAETLNRFWTADVKTAEQIRGMHLSYLDGE